MTSTKNKKISPSKCITCALSEEVKKVVVENFKQLMLAIQNETEIKTTGLFDTNMTIVKEIQEKFGNINSINELRIKDDYYISHNINVASISVAIGIKMGLRSEELKKLSLCALIHDIGKSKIPFQILLKPTRLSTKEFELVKLHAPLGAKMAKDELGMTKEICEIILQHHERFDGSGYPKNLSGQDTHLLAQILAVTDSYDALSSDRAYAKAFSPRDAVKELLSSSSKYNPQVLHTLIYMV